MTALSMIHCVYDFIECSEFSQTQSFEFDERVNRVYSQIKLVSVCLKFLIRYYLF